MTYVDVSTLSLFLLVLGVEGFIGTVVIGTVLKRGLYAILAMLIVRKPLHG